MERDQVVGQPFQNLWPPENWSTIEKHIQDTLSGQTCSFDTYRISPEEKKAWWNVKMAPIANEKGLIDRYMVISSNINNRKKNEEELRAGQERFRELSDLLPVIVYETDEEGTITYANRCAFETFGYSPEDLKDKIAGLALISHQDRERARINSLKIAGETLPDDREYLACKKDGTTFPAIFRTSPKMKNGKPDGLRGIIMDISDKKQLEQKLYHAQKMEAIGTLAGGISHDFNNILTAVNGFAELGLMSDPSENTAPEFFQEILDAGTRAKNLIKQILTFSRQEGQELSPVQLVSIIKEATKLLRATIPTTVKIQQYIDPVCEDILIMANQTMIHQIMMNLCTNAFQAMQKSGGVLDVRMSRTKFNQTTSSEKNLSLLPGDYLLLKIQDSGPGIEKEILPKIFEPYFTTKKRTEGTGLGLAVVAGIVKKHGGDILVESTVGVGTTFRVYLPITKTAEDCEQTETVMSTPGGREHILFVDDEEPLLALHKRTFFRLGYEVSTARCGAEALSCIQENPKGYDLVVTDMAMPNMDGAKLTKGIFAIRPDVPVIICTGYSEVINENLARQIGAEDFLMKPVELTELAQTIRKVLDKQPSQQ